MTLLKTAYGYEAHLKRPDGSVFTLSSDTPEGLRELVAIWQQPLEHWDGAFKSAAQLAASREETTEVSIDLNKESA